MIGGYRCNSPQEESHFGDGSVLPRWWASAPFGRAWPQATAHRYLGVLSGQLLLWGGLLQRSSQVPVRLASRWRRRKFLRADAS